MFSNETTQRMVERRSELLREASEARDVDKLIDSYSEDATFRNVYQDQTITGKRALHAFYSAAYEAIPSFKIIASACNGTVDLVALEMECEGTAAVSLQQMGLEAGATFKLRGVSLFWWRWEGERDAWNGSLDDESLRGWKIVQENAYHMPAK